MKGYKATDKDMKCRGYQFTMNEWHEHTGDLKMCESGFHFCVYPSGVWSFYNYEGTRVFEIEAEDLLDTPIEAGSAVKKVCRRIRFVKEIFPDGNRNTGYSNTGYGNTGYSNTGYGNTGDRNTGYSNTGYGNTGHSNTGDSNTGDSNTGDRNTGHSNTGDRNTGYGNCCDRSSGHFNTVTPPLIMFDLPTDLEPDIDLVYGLSCKLAENEDFDCTPFLALPNATEEKIKALHKMHIEKRKSEVKG